MNGRRPNLIIRLLRPPLVLLRFVLENGYGLLFGRWLDKRLARKDERRLARDIKESLWFLFSEFGARIVPNEGVKGPPPFDYAVVTVSTADLSFKFVRGRGELDVYVGPQRLPKTRHELSLVLSLVGSPEGLTRQPLYRLPNVERLLRPHMGLLREAFSEARYPDLEKRLLEVYDNDRLVTRRMEDRINRRLGTV
jgi:hypothetical protein